MDYNPNKSQLSWISFQKGWLLADSYLYKVVLAWEQIQKPEKLTRLLQALALQVGSQVSYNELGQVCGLDSKTVEKYINVLEQTFVVFRSLGSSRSGGLVIYNDGIGHGISKQRSIRMYAVSCGSSVESIPFYLSTTFLT